MQRSFTAEPLDCLTQAHTWLEDVQSDVKMPMLRPLCDVRPERFLQGRS